jgi:predicted permease
VLFVAGLFLSTFRKLATRPLGFTAERLLVIDVATPPNGGAGSGLSWPVAMEAVRNTTRVQSAAAAAWPLLSGNRWTSLVGLPGQPVEPRAPNFLSVSSQFFETMGIGWIAGRDFRPTDLPPRMPIPGQPLPGVGIVNETFARQYFDGQNPVGRTVHVRQGRDSSAAMEIVGYVRDAVYSNVREPVPPTVYVPLRQRQEVSFLVRTQDDPLPMAPAFRQAIMQAGGGFGVQQMQLQENFVRWHMVRERLLATLSAFFALVALVLAAVGMYGILNYTVSRQGREISIRMALGARAEHVLRGVTAGLAMLICLGSAVGLVAGVASGRLLESLLYEIKATDLDMLVAPVLTLAAVAVLAALPPAVRAIRIQPAQALRVD